jgi:hypothetical protein
MNSYLLLKQYGIGEPEEEPEKRRVGEPEKEGVLFSCPSPILRFYLSASSCNN